MKGKRYPRLTNEDQADWHERMEPGGYRTIEKQGGGWTWECRTPNGLSGTLGRHQVTQHEDETITVSPSILIERSTGPNGAQGGWHGYLERGVWREC